MKAQSFSNHQALIAIMMINLCLGPVISRTIDEIIADSSSPEVTNFEFHGGVKENFIRLELDMLLTAEQYIKLYNKKSSSFSSMLLALPRQKRKASSDLTSRWTNKLIPYIIDSSGFSSPDIAEINMAIQEWEVHTCIRFKTATSVDSAFIFFKDGSDCSSHVGMTGRKQSINLAVGCRFKGIIAHEIGHAVGFFHEQNRPDRDDYIIVKQENIKHPNYYHNFDKYSSEAVSTHSVPYDYKSIMHYGGRAFSGNKQYTIVTKDPAFQEVIGNRMSLSFNDIKLANLMYRCSEGCRSPVTCPQEGFLGKDCQCWCPGSSIHLCEKTSVVTASPTVRTTVRPTVRPKTRPTVKPRFKPTVKPRVRPTGKPRVRPTGKPRVKPTKKPRVRPTGKPRVRPTGKPKVKPTNKPKTCKDRKMKCRQWARLGYCRTNSNVRVKCKATCGMCGRRI